jgi:hypothetical protein
MPELWFFGMFLDFLATNPVHLPENDDHPHRPGIAQQPHYNPSDSD